LVAAAEEERFRRIKHWAGFPSEAVRYCLSEAKIGLDDLDHVAVNQNAKANLWRKISFILAQRPNLGLILDRVRNKNERSSIPAQLQATFAGRKFTGQVHHVEHHLAHLASSFLVSPFNDAVVISVDGFGDFASAAWGIGSGQDITVDDKVYFPHSLGIFYEALTQWLGFPNYGDEYKVMGLAPYGEPKFMTEMRRIVHLRDDGAFRLNLDFFRHHNEKVEYEWENGEPKVGRLFSVALNELLGPARQKGDELTQRHKDIARSVQAMYEEALFHLLQVLHRRHGGENLALAGGCAMNSVANGKVLRSTPYKRVYIPPAAGDAGGSIGAALTVWHKFGGKRAFVMDHAYWGPRFGEAELRERIGVSGEELKKEGCIIEEIKDEGELCLRTAQEIAKGKVIGWFQGRMEWGPRALGNRSILGDPRRADMKDILNLKIKRRESFRPFAPSILREAVPAWFETDDDVPFMMQVYQIREGKRQLIPAVTHVDGSGRLQTVCRHANQRYYRLIEAFQGLTGVPILLNTSFNENEPVVCRPDEALDCFLRTQMDVLVLGEFVISRRESEG
jgi:carbamoyltransferase